MTIENLIVCGCSFTEGHMLSRQVLPKEITWGSSLAKKQNWNLHNIAIGGMGNEWISQQTISFLENNDKLKTNSIVIIGWSDANRQMGIFQASPKDPIILKTIRTQDFYYEDSKKNWDRDVRTYHGYVLKYGEILYPFYSSESYSFYKTYMAIFNLKNYLELNKIPYIFFDALNQNRLVSVERLNETFHRIKYNPDIGAEVSGYFDEHVCDEILSYLNDKFANNIFDSKFIKFNDTTMLTEMRLKGWNLFTDGNDGHPNLYACEYFSDLIITEYNKLYGP